MFRFLVAKRFASGGYHGVNQVSLPQRPLKKIRLGRARPAIYHKFEVQVELSDGSVVTRRSQFPKNEIRLIQDQRNNPLWNESRDDLAVVDANAGGRLERFKEKYDSMFSIEKEVKGEQKFQKAAQDASSQKEAEDSFGMDDYLTLLNTNAQQVQSGGKLAGKKRDKK
ncbi:LAMI_0D09230g1_1 [Lachancea mirantina]|uniref:LAMI_0D09230g1_1 n=1 Tax=Lachancea mirantina TaxID=1230905 RepID=A0A1G4JDH8_9SACH|nr:LAMI_0D09230g1_1 [Lachancea mirantina]